MLKYISSSLCSRESCCLIGANPRKKKKRNAARGIKTLQKNQAKTWKFKKPGKMQTRTWSSSLKKQFSLAELMMFLYLHSVWMTSLNLKRDLDAKALKKVWKKQVARKFFFQTISFWKPLH